MKVPTIEPRLEQDPSQETSSFVNGPVVKGVSSDNNTDRAGENQPAIVPCPTNTKFAKFQKNKATKHIF